jgi:mannose-6-phosphate isomerase-like protein (cupin superfamily)
MTAVDITAAPPLPGAVGVSRLCVYDTGGGSPHMHLCCTEAYVVTAGSGLVQTLAWSGYAETPLRPGALVWFPPGTIHRLVNDGGLEIVVLMQNSGLPEAGDAVFTFPAPVLADPAAYATAAALPEGGAPGSDLVAAMRRRDLAVEGFTELRAAVARSGPPALAQFHAAAARLVAPKLALWRERWHAGALAAARATETQLDALARGDTSHLRAGAVFALDRPVEHGRRGMCGLLDTYR